MGIPRAKKDGEGGRTVLSLLRDQLFRFFLPSQLVMQTPVTDTGFGNTFSTKWCLTLIALFLGMRNPTFLSYSILCGALGGDRANYF